MSFISIRKIWSSIFICLAFACMNITSASTLDDLVSINLDGGDIIDEQLLDFYGENSFFSISDIPDSVWKKMQGKSYHENPYIKRSDLSYIRVLHCDYDGKIRLGEMVCNKAIAEDLREIFFILYKNKYPIERILLADNYDADDDIQMGANNTNCFVFRYITGSNFLSYHARGLAVDLNPRTNPYCRVKKDGSFFVQPSTSKEYCDRSNNFVYKIDKEDLAYNLFISHGFTWGGEWKSLKDYCHFEKEINQL
ncbi:D-alanyl-D-alanine carboxypeptidase [Succinivibrio dextrinosolvens DSM 3072]|uniref:D-alanyl-D-alanine carboxypeptidase n=1 Tax=Succinivibrio dextrinosolvens DSM 3072 TaxID=1123324 RepID=A0A1T4UYB1_9GAMM|nr:M15 family metallopeptidase [Succinivibrio dextrinosolvens]SKA57381.1 D-alanyl-D-alanine carboxypeptidase [Succinivibrio dextrinosolvens DSM 3072]